MTLEQLRATVEAGAVLSVTLRAAGAAFLVSAETRRGDALLVSTKGKRPREFADPRRALLLLRELGIRSAKIDAEQWRPEQADVLRPARPDAAQRMKRAHDAAAHEEQVRQRVLAAVAAADHPDAVWHDHEAVFDDLLGRLDGPA